MIVVKVGGSLYDLPDLGERLRRFLATFAGPVLIFPGGGATADVIREFDRVHHLGDEASHWLALAACSVNGMMLARLLPGTPIVTEPTAAVAIVDPYRFALADEAWPDHWPHRWEVTSDSMALRVAHVFGAEELVLLKSVAWSGTDWSEAAAQGVVDPYFPTAVSFCSRLPIRAVDFRALVACYGT